MNGDSQKDHCNDLGDEWLTPNELWQEIRENFFPPVLVLDPCPSKRRLLQGTVSYNDRDGLTLPWNVMNGVFCNPPFSDIKSWVEKAALVATRNMLLIPARTDQPWFSYALNNGADLTVIRGRVVYHHPETLTTKRPDGTAGTIAFSSVLLTWTAKDCLLAPMPKTWWPILHSTRDKRKKK